jgi:hypothetical protein
MVWKASAYFYWPIMFSGLDQREEAFAAATVSCMRPELDFGATIMFPRISIGYSNRMAT